MRNGALLFEGGGRGEFIIEQDAAISVGQAIGRSRVFG